MSAEPGYPAKFDDEAADAIDAYDAELKKWRYKIVYTGQVMLTRIDFAPLAKADAPIDMQADVLRHIVKAEDADTIIRQAAMRAALDTVKK